MNESERYAALRKAIINGCRGTARDVIDECREAGITDLRQVKSRLETAFAKMVEPQP